MSRLLRAFNSLWTSKRSVWLKRLKRHRTLGAFEQLFCFSLLFLRGCCFSWKWVDHWPEELPRVRRLRRLSQTPESIALSLSRQPACGAVHRVHQYSLGQRSLMTWHHPWQSCCYSKGGARSNKPPPRRVGFQTRWISNVMGSIGTGARDTALDPENFRTGEHLNIVFRNSFSISDYIQYLANKFLPISNYHLIRSICDHYMNVLMSSKRNSIHRDSIHIIEGNDNYKLAFSCPHMLTWLRLSWIFVMHYQSVDCK